MSQTYTLIAIVGFSLSALLVIVAVIMFFMLNIKGVRDEITGKTATRAISEIRARAKTRKRTSTQAAKQYGWEKDEISTDALKAIVEDFAQRSTKGKSSLNEPPTTVQEDEPSTTMLEDESPTTILDTVAMPIIVKEEEAVTTILVEETLIAPCDEEAATTNLGSSDDDAPTSDLSSKSNTKVKNKKRGKGQARRVGIYMLAFVLVSSLCPLDSFAWAKEAVPAENSESVAESDADNSDDDASAGTDDSSAAADDVSDQSPEKDNESDSQAQQDSASSNEQDNTSSNEDDEGTDSASAASTSTSSAQPSGSPFAAAPIICLPSQVDITEISPSGSFLPRTTTPGYTNNGSPRLWVNGSGNFYQLSSPSLPTLTFDNNYIPQNPWASINTSVVLTRLPLPETVFIDVGALSNIQVFDLDDYSNKTVKNMAVSPNEIIQIPKICLDTTLPQLTGVQSSAPDPYYATEVVTPGGTAVPYNKVLTSGYTINFTVYDGVLDDLNSGVEAVEIFDGDPSASGVKLLDAQETAQNSNAYSAYITTGFYQFSNFWISIHDHAGNVTNVNLENYLGASAPNYQAIDINPLLLQNTWCKAEFADKSSDRYFSTPRTFNLLVSDMYFNKNLAINGSNTLFTVKRDGNVIDTFNMQDLSPGTPPSPSTYSYACNQEGHYEITVSYRPYVGAPFNQTIDFYIDTTLPNANDFQLNPLNPLYHGWVFSPDSASFTFTLTDNLSGIDPDSISIDLDGITYKNNDPSGYLTVTPSGSNNQNAIVHLSLPQDDRQIDLSKVSVNFADRAGMSSSIDNLEVFSKNYYTKEGFSGIAVDTEDPILELTCSGGVASNGYYFNAQRLATVTLSEASFELMQSLDPNMVIATRTFGEATSPVYAKDFTNPSKDGITWKAEIPCDADGVYKIDASFTDAAKKSAQSLSDSFVVDTRQPMIMVSFDNNNARNGWYFNAPRTALITIVEENFSPDLASVAIQATDSHGNEVSAPGVSTWAQVSKGRWEARVHFANEYHYSLQVGCSDLAGNVGQSFEVPEFVIDMTAPTLSIEEVEDFYAYGNEIAPVIKYTDENFQPYLCKLEIVGLSQEDQTYFRREISNTSTSQTITFEDFDYVLKNDDIYYLSASITDLAGNTVEKELTFSVNRFGSNYLCSKEVEEIFGSYLNQGQEVVITEVNVSGLETSNLRLVKNDEVSALLEDDDYEVVLDSPQGGWSQYSYVLPAELFEDDAYYRVLLSSRDKAGNYNENLMHAKNADRSDVFAVNFVVDGTDPIAYVGNVTNEAVYFGPSKRVDVLVGDNIEAEKATLIVDGQVLMEWNEADLATDRSFNFDLLAADGTHEVKIEVKDKAGNSTITAIGDIVVTNDWFRYALNTPSILYPLVAGIILGVGIIAIIVGRLIGKRHMKKESRGARVGARI